MLLAYIGSLPQSGEAQAAYVITYTQLFSLITWTSAGLLGATAAVSGQNLGAGRPERTIHAVHVASGIGLAVASTVGVLFLTVPRVLLGFFGVDDPLVTQMAVQLLTFLSASGLFITVALAYTGGLQGTGTRGVHFISPWSPRSSFQLGSALFFRRWGNSRRLSYGLPYFSGT